MYDPQVPVGAEATESVILSADVPVNRGPNGVMLERPWLCSFITCAAPDARFVPHARAASLLDARIGRILRISRAYGYRNLVLGAWGCGVFANDAHETARSFHRDLDGPSSAAFEEVVFAITGAHPRSAFETAFKGTQPHK